MQVGIVGLPNVGKSSLFNALTKAGAQSSNYPFTTIDPNVGMVAVPDKRLDRLFEIFNPPKKTASLIKFVDIAGLVKGASKGEGLGNKFLANIREVDVIVHVIRMFEDENVTHVMNTVDPVRDAEIIETELMLSDLETAGKMIEKQESLCKTGSKEDKARLEVLKKIKQVLEDGKPASVLDLSNEEKTDLHFLTLKPILYVGNNAEKSNKEYADKLQAYAKSKNAEFVDICIKLEEEIADLDDDEKHLFLAELGSDYTGLEKIVLASKKLLGLATFFTAGEDTEVRSWIFEAGSLAPVAAGKIHTDIERGFIRAEIYNFEDIDKYESEKVIKEKGLMKSEGKDYIMKDGDICFFKFNV
ncbi:MAG: redox-regulated ATPase YchF [Elusimicrobiaceae bacterium]|jgi:ribosome-binding ATPase|nr:redox-regulated ATPase YchF [Elusimicrobiaceae bacterium]MBT3954975.1 redox-regulated ATPase YchF [Elusimicrobiaceae bacterium]MBT4008133.1 redox-regulated ATPase YchF [Elusimicrobiaceae bacterium]MBT4402671.1 redox-regulated ATPase YchF [Elusimicrobiaceae bacterium]MBT4440045.1 redox-regulated ATPase YchF [Elusimicrobiaceae bacterium]